MLIDSEEMSSGGKERRAIAPVEAAGKKTGENGSLQIVEGVKIKQEEFCSTPGEREKRRVLFASQEEEFAASSSSGQEREKTGEGVSGGVGGGEKRRRALCCIKGGAR